MNYRKFYVLRLISPFMLTKGVELLSVTQSLKKSKNYACPFLSMPTSNQKLTPDGYMITEIFIFRSYRKNIGSFVRASWAIVWPPMEILRLRQQLRERWQKLWYANKLPKDLAKIHFRHEIVLAPRQAIVRAKSLACQKCRSILWMFMFVFNSCWPLVKLCHPRLNFLWSSMPLGIVHLTKITSCPFVWGRQQDNLKASQCRQVAIVL